MAAIPGSVRVGGFIAPTDSTDTYAVTDDAYGRGGAARRGTRRRPCPIFRQGWRTVTAI